MTCTALPPASMLPPTDDELMARIEAGDVEDSLTLLQSRHRRAVFDLVRGMVGDPHLAQDITQEAFAKVFLKSHLYRPENLFRGWLFEIARNQALSALRKRRRTPRPFSSLGSARDETDREAWFEPLLAQSDEPRLEEQELMVALRHAVAHLPELYQQVFHMCVEQEMPYQQAAEALAIPTGTVAVRLMRARQRLFRVLSPHFDRLRRPPGCVQSLD